MHTFKSGTKSGPNGVSTLTRMVCTFQVPRNSSGKVRSEGPPPRDDQALSTASGNRLAYAKTAVAESSQELKWSMPNSFALNKAGCDTNQEAKPCLLQKRGRAVIRTKYSVGVVDFHLCLGSTLKH